MRYGVQVKFDLCRLLKFAAFLFSIFNALNFIHKSTNLPHFSRKTRTAKIMTPNLQDRPTIE
ncbi:hypothetical protein CSUNSWCD_278 [Campylobacter showae CSUNSWCD]|uniref:Uncharacterized protein n=1 Tax=Campylobacter showae CSUNSWCD TaxID=1244083 RepID=M5IT42_9BACT|nr:hypothetical protein CSUNSWCD_278 [Campylobacter showae CSUNSWCD]